MLSTAEAIQRNFGSDEKKRLIDILKVIVSLSNKAYYQGPLSLEDDCPFLHSSILRKGIEMIIEGCSAKEIRGMFEGCAKAGQYSEIELLEGLIIREGVLSIQNGEKENIYLKSSFPFWERTS